MAKIELKKVSVFDRMSQETTAFAADIYMDGVKVGDACNDGRGGATLVHIDRGCRDAFTVWSRANVPSDMICDGPLADGVGFLLSELLKAREEKRLAKVDAKEVARNLAQGRQRAISKQLVLTQLAVES